MPKGLQLIPRALVLEHVAGEEVDAVFAKELLGAQATGSTRVPVDADLVVVGSDHGICSRSGCRNVVSVDSEAGFKWPNNCQRSLVTTALAGGAEPLWQRHCDNRSAGPLTEVGCAPSFRLALAAWRCPVDLQAPHGDVDSDSEAQRAVESHLSPDRGNLSGDWRAGRARAIWRARLPSALSPASVRNVMSDLEHLGLIYAPHTSAGRLPTQSGLRMFVDGLLEIGNLTVDERRQIEAQIASRRNKPVDQMLCGRRRDDLRPLTLRRPGAVRKAGHAPEAYRVRGARARQGPGGARRR